MFSVTRFDAFDEDKTSNDDENMSNKEILNELMRKSSKRKREKTSKKKKKKKRERKVVEEEEESTTKEEDVIIPAPSGLAKIGALLNRHEEESERKDTRRKRIAEAFASINAENEKKSHTLHAENESKKKKLTASEWAKKWNLRVSLVERIKKQLPKFFPIQRVVIPSILATRCENAGRPRDICISAPTGSGKTLSYVIPIVNDLIPRIVCRVRALVVLPTRELAAQVKTVFEQWTENTNLKVALVTGQNQFSREQREIVRRNGTSRVDILVATPGRLLDHIRYTTGFTLSHLSYLVIDEADRLLNQSYQDWIHHVHSVLQSTNDGSIQTVRASVPGHVYGDMPIDRTGVSCRKIVVSATLTMNPRALSALKLRAPMNFVASNLPADIDGSDNEEEVEEKKKQKTKRFATPETLEEHLAVCTMNERPLVLLRLLRYFATRKERTLIFAASLDKAHRLTRLLQVFSRVEKSAAFDALEISRQMPQKERTETLRRFETGACSVIVCTDSMARGVDLESITNVVNYDVPVYAKTYIHRAGRAARAGRRGCCYTLLRSDQVRHFKNMLRRIDNSFVKTYKYTSDDLKVDLNAYIKSLDLLKQVIGIDSNGDYVSMDHARSKIQSIVSEWMNKEKSKRELRKKLGLE
eukprot:g6351.t1